MVRVAGLKRQIEKGVSETAPTACRPPSRWGHPARSVIRLLRDAHDCWTRELVPALESEGIHILNYCRSDAKQQRAIANRYFQETVFPMLTPLAFDPGRPFPHISNLSLNLAVLIRDR